MCGVVGVLGLDDSLTTEVLRRMSAAVAHRGPDDAGEEIVRSASGVVGLGHRRLAILDLSSLGHQPMKEAITGNWISYNGEIYNLNDLRSELEGYGYKFRSRTDTEVVLAAYGKWGLEAFGRLRGMFAFSLWDESRKRLVLARDPFGIKPLYYYKDASLFLFASEVRALLRSGLVSRRLSKEGLASYLQFGSVQGPWTAIHNVCSLQPGHYMLVESKNNGVRVEEVPYCGKLSGIPTLPRGAVERREAVVTLRELLKESVRLHLVSDVPLCTFLSGGLDSSALVALVSQVSTDRPRTFTVVFAEKEFSESSHARSVAQRFRTEHQEILLSERDLLAVLPIAFRAMDQPTMDGINTFVISRAVREAGIVVALSGLGGDELFAGYPTFRRAMALQRIAKIPQRLRRLGAGIGKAVLNKSTRHRKFWELMEGNGTPRAVYTVSRELFPSHEVRNLLYEGWAPAGENIQCDNGDGNHINSISLLELRGYMANTLLRDTDCMSMAHALEVRVPFVDPVITKYVLGLPGEWKVDARRPKPLLLDAVGGLLSEKIWQRRKMGFTFPFERWMRSALKPDLEEVLHSRKDFEQIGMESKSIAAVWKAFNDSPRKVSWSCPWALYVLKKWCELNQVTM